MCWSNVDMDLLIEIMKRVDYVDAIRSEAVCSNWRFSQCRKYPIKRQILWLMFSSKDDDSRYFYSIKDNKMICKISLPDIAGHRFVGSSNGYLLSVDPNSANLVATNPLAVDSRLPLPPFSALHNVITVVRDSSSGRITGYEMNNLHHFRLESSLTFSLEQVCTSYYKAILSYDAKTAVVMNNIWGDVCWLAFARVGDQSWTGLRKPHDPYFHDIILHKGRLYGINCIGDLAIFDLDHPSDLPFIMSPEGPFEDTDYEQKGYLVESPCREKLFLVVRLFGEGYYQRTSKFRLYLLDDITYTWKQIKTIGETSLFLGFNYSVSVCTKEFPGLKKNCIYFTHDDRMINYMYLRKGARDTGIHSLEDGSVVPLYQDSNLDKLNQPPPIWFVHNIS